MLFWCLIHEFVSLSVYKDKTVWLQKLSMLLSLCLTFHIRVVHFFGILKSKVFTRNIYVYFHKKRFFLGLPNLGAQISCAQNHYTADQIELKYPLLNVDKVVFFFFKYFFTKFIPLNSVHPSCTQPPLMDEELNP